MVNSFILVIFVYAGAFAKSDSVALLQIPQPTLQACQEAGKQIQKMDEGTTKNIKFTCIKNSQDSIKIPWLQHYYLER